MGDLSRRGFLGAMASAVASASLLAVDPERLLWEPGKKTIIDLGAARAIEAPTLAETLKFSHIFDPSKWSTMSVDALKPVYRPDRFQLDLAEHGRLSSVTFDSDGRVTYGHREGVPMSDYEKADFSAALARSRSRIINLRTLQVEE